MLSSARFPTPQDACSPPRFHLTSTSPTGLSFSRPLSFFSSSTLSEVCAMAPLLRLILGTPPRWSGTLPCIPQPLAQHHRRRLPSTVHHANTVLPPPERLLFCLNGPRMTPQTSNRSKLFKRVPSEAAHAIDDYTYQDRAGEMAPARRSCQWPWPPSADR